ncbi:translation regulator (Cya5) [Histoplasma capsulatum var. duboisii H88]|nr:translation regulator (Cya5) [Histoplasma capsulatum var. duboisii H88]
MKEEERIDWKLYHEKNRSKRWRGLREWRQDLNWIRKKIPLPGRVDGEFASDRDHEAHSLHYHAKTRLNQIRDMMAKVYKLAYQDI